MRTLQSQEKALSEFDVERGNATAIAITCTRLGLCQKVLSMASALDRYLCDRRHLPEALLVHRAGLEAARSLADVTAERREAARLGRTYGQRGDSSPALEALDLALSSSRSAGDDHTLAVALGGLGNIAMNASDFDTAISLLDESSAAHGRTGNPGLQGAILASLGNCYERTNRLDLAADVLDRATSLTRQVANYSSLSAALANLGNVQRRLGKVADAIINLGQAHELAVRLAAPSLQASTANDLGRALMDAGYPGQSRRRHGDAVAIALQADWQSEVARGYWGLARVAIAEADPVGARHSFEQAAAIFDELRDPQYADVIAEAVAAGVSTNG